MSLFSQLKNMPKVDLHINLTGSISTDLAFDLTEETNLLEVEEKMIQKNARDYLESLKVPIDILRTKKNIELAINDLIDRLIQNNVIYGELFLDLPLYNKRISQEKLINLILSVIKKRSFPLNLVLCLSSFNNKDENLEIINLLEKYYLKGVNGVYFQKDKMTNLSDYYYLFDRLNKNNIPYILSLDTKVTNQDKDIYYHAKRLIYELNHCDEEILANVKKNNIMLEFPLTSLQASNVISNLKDYFIYDLLKDNYLITLTSRDMTTLNTDILNELCLLFNNCPITMHELFKVLLNNLINLNIDDNEKNTLIVDFKEKSNLVL